MSQQTINLKYVNEMPSDRSEGVESLNEADAPGSDDPRRGPIETAQEMKFDHPEVLKWDRIKAGITEIILGLLLLAALIGFALVCWEGVGYVYDVVFSVAPR